MFERARPVRLAGFLGARRARRGGPVGDERQVLLALGGVRPADVPARPGDAAREASLTAAMSLDDVRHRLDRAGVAHAVLLRELPHGDAIVVDVLVGTFVGDTGAYLGGRAFGRRKLAPRISPNKTVEGLLIGIADRDAVVDWVAGLYQDWLTRRPTALLLGARGRDRRADRRPVRVPGQARHGDQGHGHPVRRPRRRAGPPGRRAVRARRRLLRLARAALVICATHVRRRRRRGRGSRMAERRGRRAPIGR